MIYKWFNKIMLIINGLFVVPVLWVVVRELAGPKPFQLSRVAVVAGLMALPLCGTLAITIAGRAVLDDQN